LIPRDRPSELAAALIGLARDRLRAESLGRGGRARQQRLFSIDAMTRGYADLLADLAGVPAPLCRRKPSWSKAVRG
jgi:glycosyltransferase involved in cell wall biosynthesis